MIILSSTATPHKKKCDDEFYNNMLNQCDTCMTERFGNTFNRERFLAHRHCRQVAWSYHKAVRLGGLGSYKEGQRNACCCKKKR